MTSNALIRNLRLDDIPQLISLPKNEGREMGMEFEIQTWLQVDPFGIFIALDDERIVGCCSAIALTDTHGYVGMYVVKDVCRGLGIGRILWNAAINRLGNRNISLSSADKMLSFYREKAGFGITAHWTVDMYSALVPVLPPPNKSSQLLPFTIVVDHQSPFVQHVVEYDFSVHRYDRSKIVKETIREPGTLTLLCLKFSTVSAVPCGYACMKRSLQGHWLIAPVYAEDYDSAFSLVHGLMNALTDEQRLEGVVTKLVSSNFDAAKLFSQFGLQKTQYQLRRLFTKEIFHIPESKIFALQSSVFCTE